MRTHSIWFKARLQPPVREGMYEVKTMRPVSKGAAERYDPIKVPDYAHRRFRYWDGTQWFLVRKDTFEKCDQAKAFGHGLYQFWRGLTKRKHDRMLGEFDKQARG